jgi:uncharacterized protein YdaU (DUF1376 family)
MNVDLAQELLNELGSSLEDLETQHGALLQFLKDNGIVTDDQLAPYLTQAGNTSNVRWRATRVRLARLFSTEKEREEQRAEKEQQLASAAQAPAQNQGGESAGEKDKGSGEAAPHREGAAARTATESAGGQSVPARDSEPRERASLEDKKATPGPEKNGA